MGAAEEGAELGATTSTGKLTNLMATDADLIGRIAWFVWVLACWSWSLASLPLVIATQKLPLMARLSAVSEIPDAICLRVSLIWPFKSRP